MALAREMDYSMSPREAFLSVYGDSVLFNRTGAVVQMLLAQAENVMDFPVELTR